LVKTVPERPPLPPRALAADYDGTLAEAGTVSPATLDALKRVKAAGWRLLLVTGRHLDDLQTVFPGLDVCDMVVAENGAVLFDPPAGPLTTLAPPPPAELVKELARRGVRLSTGLCVIATVRIHEHAVREAIAELAPDLQPIFNKDALMILPRGVDKRSGLLAALARLALSPEEVVAVGDGENDLPFLQACGLSVAVANAVAALSGAADLVTTGERGEGVRELVEQLLSGGGTRFPLRPLAPGPLPDE
jgi:hydroxymethylpyrimidine pyrophosphatase-like HAD family hydrolase